MSLSPKILYISLILLLSIQTISPFVFNSKLNNFFSSYIIFIDFEIRDLEKTDDTFANEASSWSASNLRGSLKYSKCNGTYLLGGYNILGPSFSLSYKGEY